jgi:Zn-dependent metalloprotease
MTIHHHHHSRPCRCYILPPHIIDHMAAHPDPKISAAGQATLRATHALRTQRSLLARSARAVPTGELRRSVYDAERDYFLPGRLVRSEGSEDTGDEPVDQAYAFSGDTYNFYEQVLGRNSIDDQGMRLDSSVRYREDPFEPFDNAFWNGEQMVYGEGDGLVFGSFTASLDVIAHELTHGVTDYEAGLEYHNQPGALNESMSDVFGSMVKQWVRQESVGAADWLIGAELLLPGVNGRALRSLKEPGTAYDDPRIGTDPQPGHMRDYQVLPDTRRGDYGGVHVNSGIPNRAFYLACVNLGATYSWERAGSIWYAALRALNVSSDFAAAASATTTAAMQLFDVTAARAVRDAWREVGVEPGAVATRVTQ